MREYGLANTFLLAVILLVAACESSRAELQEFGQRQFDWSWLGENSGTYWYVPEKYLPAIRWSTDDPGGYTVISDQTVWHIEHFQDGYIFGPIAVKFETTPMVLCQFLIGSITPVGSVYIAFNGLAAPPQGSPALTIGLGRMVRVKGEWMFNMQMASGSADIQVEHSAFMRQCTPADDCWVDLPGVNLGVLAFLSHCD